MYFALRLVCSVALFALLNCTLSTCVVNWQLFQVSLAGHYQCPNPENAFQGLTTKSRSQCAEECGLSAICIDFSYYESSGRCLLYSSLPSRVSHNSDCTFMMDWNAYLYANCTAMALVKGSCRGPTDDYYGCLTLTIATSTNDTTMVCPALPGVSMQLEMVSLNLGGDLTPLPIVNNWIIMTQRFDGSLDFNRGWTDYRNGFGDIGRGEFWLGNEKVHLVTAQPGSAYQLRVEMQLYASGTWYHADYSTFSLGSESNKYAIHLSGFSGGNAGDSLTNDSSLPFKYHGGMNFSTWEADNDGFPNNCAAAYQAGWWFNNCGYACLIGPSSKWESLGYMDAYGVGLLRTSRMMIRNTM